MNNYKVVNKTVVEIPTNLVIKQFSNHKTAANLCNSLNNGGGFQGFTPGFFTKTINLKTDH